jgi:hypothetical protein
MNPNIFDMERAPLPSNMVIQLLAHSMSNRDIDEPAITDDVVRKELHAIFVPCLLMRLAESGVTLTKDALGIAISVCLGDNWPPGDIVLLAYALKRLAEKQNNKHLRMKDIIEEIGLDRPTRKAFRDAWAAQKIGGANWLDSSEAWEFKPESTKEGTS